MASVIELAQELVRRPSRGGIDDYGPVLGVLEDWLTARDLPHRRLHDDAGSLVGLLVEIPGGRPGPWWTLDACVDTAQYGDENAWSFPPASGDVAALISAASRSLGSSAPSARPPRSRRTGRRRWTV